MLVLLGAEGEESTASQVKMAGENVFTQGVFY